MLFDNRNAVGRDRASVATLLVLQYIHGCATAETGPAMDGDTATAGNRHGFVSLQLVRSKVGWQLEPDHARGSGDDASTSRMCVDKSFPAFRASCFNMRSSALGIRITIGCIARDFFFVVVIRSS